MTRKCYYISVNQFDENGYIPSLVEEGVAGYAPMKGNGPLARPWYWGRTYEEAKEICAKANFEDFGLTEKETAEIVMSSMRETSGHRWRR